MMIIEHQDLTESMENFKQADNFENLNEIGNHIINLLRGHINKEKNILFMMAEMHFNDKKRRQF